jgi:surface antigen
MKAIDDNTLIAYLDGELDDAAAAGVEKRLARDPALSSRVEEFRRGDDLLRAAFNQSMLEANPPKRAPAALNAEKRRVRRIPRQWGPLPLALAASLAVLLIGGLTGLVTLDTLVEREFERQALIKANDNRAMVQARMNALENEISGTDVSWTNPDSGSFGKMTPVRTWRTKSGQYCREFHESATMDGVTNVERGVACRTADGLWKVRLRYYPE